MRFRRVRSRVGWLGRNFPEFFASHRYRVFQVRWLGSNTMDAPTPPGAARATHTPARDEPNKRVMVEPPVMASYAMGLTTCGWHSRPGQACVRHRAFDLAIDVLLFINAIVLVVEEYEILAGNEVSLRCRSAPAVPKRTSRAEAHQPMPKRAT